MKKSISYFFTGMVLIILLGMSIVSTEKEVFAAEGVEDVELIQSGDIDEEKYDIQYAMDSIELYNAGEQDIADVREAIYNAIVSCDESVNIQGYSLTIDEAREAFKYVINNNPELFYVSSIFRYSYSYSNPNYVVSLILTYEYSGETLDARRAAFDSEVNKIISGIDDSWSDLEKAIYIHDYFCAHYKYDETFTKYDAADLFVDKEAVCNGYYLGYKYILDKLGIENDSAESSEMNHIWNQIKINDNWYNVDITWDDPLSDIIGRTNHGHFLKSDETFISEYNHYDWTSNHTCDDTSYDTSFWNSVISSFAFANNTWYCISGKDLYTCDINNTNLKNRVLSVGNWYVSGSSTVSWAKAYAGLGAYGGKIYYNTAEKLMSYNPQTGQSIALMNGTGTIYGSYLDKNIIYYGYGDSPNSEVSESGTYELELSEEDSIIKTSSITLDSEELSLYVGATGVLTATVGPDDATDKSVIWTSSNDSVVTVDEQGNVKAVKAGAATITATTADTGIYAVCTVNVKVKSGWKKDSIGWWYLNEDGTYPKNAWRQIAGKWYHFDASGYMQTGWYKEGSAYYYLKADGSMASNEWIDNGKYYVNASGKWVTGSWKKNAIGWWYLNPDGTYPKNKWQQIDGKWYHFDTSGYMQTGWYKEGSVYYYLKADGSMAKNEWVDNGKYYVDSNGHWVKDKAA